MSTKSKYSDSNSKVKQGGDEQTTKTVQEARQGVSEEANAVSLKKWDRNENRGKLRFFVTYTGVKLPFKLVNELQASEVENRNTYFQGYFEENDRLTGFDKLAYGEIELAHRYTYHGNGKLSAAEITDIDGETTMLIFDTEGSPA